jgi:hypothetical protein
VVKSKLRLQMLVMSLLALPCLFVRGVKAIQFWQDRFGKVFI